MPHCWGFHQTKSGCCEKHWNGRCLGLELVQGQDLVRRLKLSLPADNTPCQCTLIVSNELWQQLAVSQSLCSDCQKQLNFLIKMPFTIYNHLKHVVQGKYCYRCLLWVLKVLLWKIASLATENVKRTELNDSRCKWHVGTVWIILAHYCNL